MIRLIGSVLLAGGAAALGFGAVQRLDGRVRDLRGLEAGMEALRRELSWRMAPLPEALSQAAEATDGRPARFLQLCARGAVCLNGRPFHELWREAAEDSQMRLEREDMELLERLGAVLGRYDGDSQREALETAAIRLAEQRAQAAERRGRLGRVYSVLGVSAGLLLVILLL